MRHRWGKKRAEGATTKIRPNFEGKCSKVLVEDLGWVAASGQLLRPDEDTVAAFVLLIEDQRRAETFEVLHGEFQVFQVHAVAA